MTVLLLRFAAPLQSWGTGSRFVRRNTDRMPSRSGVIGLLAAATGHCRTDSIEDFRLVRIGVRIDQPGRVERDFQTARSRDGDTSMPLSYRFYLADAVFAVAVEAEPVLLDSFRAALCRPAFPLFLGRRSCPPAGILVHGLHDGGVEQVLHHTPWLASKRVQSAAHRESHVTLTVVHDCPPGTPKSEVVRDDPISFDPRHRQYGWRTVRHTEARIPNPKHSGASDVDPHDPMALLGGSH